jgi:RNA polymerase-binding transcription factor
VEGASEEQVRKLLSAERAAVDAELAELEAGSGAGIEPASDEGFSDSAQAASSRAEVLGRIEELEAARREVDAAERRLTEGRYGVCERCGNSIAPARLETLPTARLCVGCKQVRH